MRKTLIINIINTVTAGTAWKHWSTQEAKKMLNCEMRIILVKINIIIS